MTSSSGPVLVTGATGFIGARLVARLVGLGVPVHAVSRRPVTSRTPGVGWWTADLTDPVATASLLRRVRPAAVVHLAGEAAAARDPGLVLSSMRANLTTVVHLLSAAVERPGTQVVLANSIEEPDRGTTPSSPYTAAKSAASGYARMFHELWDLPVTTFRIAMVYGPGQRDLTKLVPHVVTSLLAGTAPRLSSGRREIDWVFVDDVVDAFVAALDRPDSAGAPLEIGSGRAVSIREVADRLVAVTGAGTVPHYGALPDRLLEETKVADLRSAREVLGWRPTTALDDGLARTVEWFRAHPPGP